MAELDSLLECLRSPDTRLRMSVLATLEGSHWPSDQVERLRAMIPKIPDPYLRTILPLVLSRLDPQAPAPSLGDLERELTLIASPPSDPGSVGEGEGQPSSPEKLPADPLRLALLVTGYPTAIRPLAVETLREFGLARLPEDCLPAVLRLVRQHGSSQDVPVLLDLCRSTNPRVLATAAEALEKISPEDLRSLLVPLLTNSSPEIHSQAIRLLYRWDPEEALRHFRASLESDSIEERRAALFQAYFFPFDQIESLLLRMLGPEQEIDLVKQAATLFQVNPDLGAIARLVEIYESVADRKQAVLKEVITSAVDLLARSGQTDMTPEELLQELRRKCRRQKWEAGLAQCRRHLTDPRREVRQAVLVRLLEMARVGFSPAREVLAAHVGTEPDPELRSRLQASLAEEPGGRPSPASPLSATTFSSAREALQAEFSCAAPPRRLAIVQAFFRWADEPGAISFLEGALADPDEQVRLASFEALVTRAPDRAARHGEGMLEGSSPEGQITLLRHLAGLDKPLALTALTRLLFSVHSTRRQIAILALDAFDLPSIEACLVQAFAQEPDREVRDSLCAFLASHFHLGLLEPLVIAVSQAPSDRRPVLEADLNRLAEAAGEATRQQGPEVTPQTAAETAGPTSRRNTAPGATGAATRRNTAPGDSEMVARLAALRARPVSGTGTGGAEYSVERVRRRRSQFATTAMPPSPEGQQEGRSPELADAASPDPVTSFLGLLRARPESWTSGQVREAENLRNATTDSLTRFHLDLRLALRAPGHGGSGSLPPDPPLVILERALAVDPPDGMTIALTLERVSRRDQAEAAAMLRTHRWRTLPTAVLPFVIAFFKRGGTAQDGPAIEPFCRDADPRVAMTAVEALERLNPDDLRPRLVELLGHPSHGVRTVGIRLLYKWDRREALAHLEGTLFAPAREERAAALHHAFFLPFEAVEEPLVRFLGLEDDLDLVRRAGLLFRSNPASHLPMRLLEVRETCSGEKRRLIEETLGDVAGNLRQAGLIAQSAQEFLADLMARYKTARIARFLDQCRVAIQSSDPGERSSGVEHLTTLLPHAREAVLALLQELASRETDSRVRQVLAGVIPLPPLPPPSPREPGTLPASPAETGVVPPPPPAPVEEITAVPEWVSALDQGSFRAHRTELLGLLVAANTPAPLRATLLHQVASFGTAEDLPQVRRHLKDFPPVVQAAAIEALAALDPESLLPLLPRFLRQEAPEVREAAIRAFLRHDKRQALTFVEQLLGSTKPEERSRGLFAAGAFEFSAVRELVLGVLGREDVASVARQAWTLVLPHLDLELLSRVVSLAEEPPATRQGQWQAFLAEGAARLQAQPGSTWASPEAVLQEARQRSAQDRERRRNPPAYSWQSLRQARPSAPPAPPPEPTVLEQAAAAARQLPPWALGSGFAALLLLGALAFWPGGGEPPAGPTAGPSRPVAPASMKVSYRTHPLQADQVRDIQGAIEATFSDGTLVALDGVPDKVFVRYPKPPREFLVGQAFRASVKVVRRTPERVEADLVRMY